MKGYAKTTIVTYISAVQYYHKLLDTSDIANNSLIKSCLSGIKNRGYSKKRRSPVKLSDLRKILATSESELKTEESIQFKAICSLLFFGFFRISEILGDIRMDIKSLTRERVEIKHRKIVIKLDKYKHSKGEGAKVILRKQTDKNICPVTNMSKHISTIGDRKILFVNKRL